MKRFFILLIVLLTPVAFLIGCNEDTSNDTVTESGSEKETENDTGNKNESDIETGDDTAVDDNEKKGDEESGKSLTDDMQKKMDELNFTEFKLEVKYSGNKEYEADIEQETNGVEAEIDDELNNIKLKGEEAFNDIYPKVSELTITPDTSMKDAIQQVIDTFQLDPDYDKIEVEITFTNGSKIEYEDKKKTK